MDPFLLRIFAAGIVSVIIGYVWYYPRFFGGVWMRLSGLTPEIVERGQRRKHIDMLSAIAASLLAAYAMHYLFSELGIYSPQRAALLAFILWIGFVAPSLLGTVVWEQKPITLYLINALYWLVSFLAMSVILII